MHIAHRVEYLHHSLITNPLTLLSLQDAFCDNFLVEWQPESLRTMSIAPCRPRVYLIDFELAVEFPDDCPLSEHVSIGPPLGGSLPNTTIYRRCCPPEVHTGDPYSPYKLDVWQFGYSIRDFEVLSHDSCQLDMTLIISRHFRRISLSSTLF